MSVTATAVIASAFIGAEKVDAASHTVKSGDTLWSISQKYDTNVAQLQSWNKLDGNIIYPKQTLEVGDGGKASSVKESAPKKVTENSKTDKPKKQAAQTNKKPASADKKPAKASESSTSTSTYTVKSGDTLSAISFAHGISLENLMAWNGLESTLIFPGDKLNVKKGASKPDKNVSAPPAPAKPKEDKPVVEKPKEDKPAAEKPKPEKPKTEKPAEKPAEKPNKTDDKVTGASTYTVKKGDTLNAIASRHSISLDNLMAWNNLTSTLIHPGDTLAVKKSASAEKPTKKPANPKPDKVDKQPAPTGDLISTAKSVLGTPYVWGGQTKSGFDCSGFIHYALAGSGSNMARQSTDGYYNRSYIVNTPAVGDFVFFENTYKKGISHMGIYLGDNKFIHASTSQGVTVTDLSNPYWSERFHSYKKMY